MFPVEECRILYSQAAEKEDFAKKIIKISAEWKENDALAQGYWGTANMVLAKFAFFPLQKLTLFQKGKNSLQNAIKIAPNVTELRFLRLSIQISAPRILQYFENIAEDKAFILKHIEKEELSIQRAFKTFSEKYDV